MIIVKLMGGLGNQMFQYAAALRLAEMHRTIMKLDLTFLLDRTPRANFVFRNFDLEVFDIKGPVATLSEVQSFFGSRDRDTRTLYEKIVHKIHPRHFYIEPDAHFDPKVLALPNNTYIEGYFQHEAYFGEISPQISRRFRLQNPGIAISEKARQVAEQISSTSSSICLNVRRADYVSNPVATQFHGVCSLRYFDRALTMLQSRGIEGAVFVFSDDIEWCREHFGNRPRTVVVPHDCAGPSYSTYLWLMTMCHNFIIPNSTFAWWAAWLSRHPNKVVVRPVPWFRDARVRDVDICPKSWLACDAE